MKKPLILAFLAAALTAGALPAAAAAQYGAEDAVDRTSFGGDIVVHQGETVNDVVTMGGDVLVQGEVLGDVATMGGDVAVLGAGVVHGEATTMGGDVLVEDSAAVLGGVHSFGGAVLEGATAAGTADEGTPDDGGEAVTSPAFHFEVSPEGPASAVGRWLSNAVKSFMSHVLLFVLGLLLIGVAKERFEGLQVAIVRKPAVAFGYGLLGLVVSTLAIVVFAVTIIGIPAAILGAVALPIAVYVGLAAFAAVFGAVLPFEALRDKPILQMGAGVLCLFLVSLVPVAGGFASVLAAAIGFGALILTRFKPTASLPPEITPVGPYRTAS